MLTPYQTSMYWATIYSCVYKHMLSGDESLLTVQSQVECSDVCVFVEYFQKGMRSLHESEPEQLIQKL